MVAACTTEEMEAPPKQAPKPAPMFSLKSINDKTVSLADFKGRPLVVNFWATWCAPCLAEMPLLEKVRKTWKGKGLEVLMINIKESQSAAGEFMKGHGYSFRTLLDETGEVSEKFQVFGLPTTYFIDKNGVIQYTHMGELTQEIIAMGLEAISLVDL